MAICWHLEEDEQRRLPSPHLPRRCRPLLGRRPLRTAAPSPPDSTSPAANCTGCHLTPAIGLPITTFQVPILGILGTSPPIFDFSGRQLHKAPPHSCDWVSTSEGATERDGGSNGTLASMSISLSGGALNCVIAHVGEIRHGGVRENHMHSTCNETFVIWGARTKIRVVRAAAIRFLLVDSLNGLATGCLVQWYGLFFGGACHSLLGSCYRRGLLLTPAALERLGRTWLS